VSWAPHGFDSSRRAFLLTALGVASTPKAVAAQERKGFHVTGVVSPSQEPDIFYIGFQFGLIAAPKTEPHRLLTLAVNSEVKVYVEPA
jgi:ABC-type sugar transport system substrate-binding protein